ncbi:MAG: hypothetical protein E6R04_11875 [Spirochaetes bacterium]|nr:MAG: hypothetical protein E6R04_11875 [Spirochaetota bacterium]
MALQILINGIDRTSLVLWDSLQWHSNMNNEVDTMSISIQKFGTRTFRPENGDILEFYDSSVLVFSGPILKADESIESVDRLVYHVMVKDNSHEMNRYLVRETYNEKPLINVICDIFNKYVNKKKRVEIADFEPTEIWTAVSGLVAVDTENYITGNQGLRITSEGGSTATVERYIFLDLTQNNLGATDYLDIDVWAEEYSEIGYLELVLTDSGGGEARIDLTSLIVKNGHNYIHTLRSAWSEDFDFHWYEVVKQTINFASTGDDIYVTLDNWQMISADAYTRINANNATQIVKNAKFNFEEPTVCINELVEKFAWKWYVDPNKDLHIFDIYDEVAAYNLSDTNGNYIYRSLKISNNVDQLRNSIYVRGGEYLDDAVTEDLRHQIDGNNAIFKVGYKYDLDTVTLTLNGDEVAVGADNIDKYNDNQGVLQRFFGTLTFPVGNISGSTKQSQQIIAARKGRRTKIKLRLYKVGNPVDNFQLQVFSDDGNNQPSGSSLSTIAMISGASLSTSSTEKVITITESVADSLLFDKNEKYHIIANRSGANNASNYYVIDGYEKVYDGISYSGTSAPAWTAFTNQSWYFSEVLGFEALLDNENRRLTLQSTPLVGDILSLEGQPFKPVFVQVKENASIAEFGEWEFRVVDKTIITKEAARQRARQEILSWAGEISEGMFRTYVPGLRVGATINVQSTIRGINQDFLINKISARPHGSNNLEYTVSLVTKKTLGILYWLQKQLLLEGKNVEIDDNDELDKLESFSEEFSFSDSVTVTLYTGKVWSNDAGTTPNKLIWSGGATHIWV